MTKVTGLELRLVDIQTNSRKFYRIYSTRGGWAFAHYGRIGTRGQTHRFGYEKFWTVRDKKMSEGYNLHIAAQEFEIPATMSLAIASDITQEHLTTLEQRLLAAAGRGGQQVDENEDDSEVEAFKALLQTMIVDLDTTAEPVVAPSGEVLRPSEAALMASLQQQREEPVVIDDMSAKLAAALEAAARAR